jgi:copper homeostasis protein
VPRPTVEIAVQDLAGVAVALDAGAERVELCSALEVGGLTPSSGLIAAAVEMAATRAVPDFVHVLIRPRAGGFVYRASEVDVIRRDVVAAISAGASGVVIGALTAVGTIDVDTVAALVEAADGRQVTFHRAIDAVGDPLSNLDLLISLGVTRVLTSGGSAVSGDGRVMLARLVERSAGRIQIMAGGGVTVADIPALLASGVHSVHLSARTEVNDPAPAGPGGGTISYSATDPGVVGAAISAVRAVRLV